MDDSDDCTTEHLEDSYSTLPQVAGAATGAGLKVEDKDDRADIDAHTELSQQGQHTYGQEVPGQGHPDNRGMGDIAVIEGKKIYHCTLPLPKWNAAETTFRNTMSKLLSQACDAKRTTLAIPAPDAHLDSVPSSWDPMAHDMDVLLKQIKEDSNEFTIVNNRFQEGLGTVRATITGLDRIQNKTIYWQYQAKKKLLEKKNKRGTVEKTLWHGTKVNATMSICTHGFNRGYCDSKSVLGEGVYFTIDAGYAARDRYAAAADNKNRHMFMCKVLTGEYTTGSQGIRVPPLKDPNNRNSQYDSVVDDVNDPKTFVIFNDSQAYPEYLISFK